MSDITSRERLNHAAELLGIPERLPPDCGQAHWTELLTRVIAALAQRALAVQQRDGAVRRHALLDSARLPGLPPGEPR